MRLVKQAEVEVVWVALFFSFCVVRFHNKQPEQCVCEMIDCDDVVVDNNT